MPGLAVVATQLTTPDTKPYRLFVENDDVLTGAGGFGVPIESLQWEHSGGNSPAVLSADFVDQLRAITIQGHADVRLWDNTAGTDLFSGLLMARAANVIAPSGRVTQMRAQDASLELDRNIVTGCSFPAGLSDRDIIQGLCGQFLKGTLSFNATDGVTTFIASTNAAMDAMTFEMQTLRSAIEQVAIAANEDGLGERFLYVDAQRRIRYRKAPTALTAPYAITDGVPGGGEKNVSDLQITDDDSAIITAVYVKGANALGSGWVANRAAAALYGWRADQLDAPDSNTARKALSYGNSFLSTRAYPIRRGTFSITGTTGWKADQLVTITSTSLGLSAVQFEIAHVTVNVVVGTPTFRHSIEFGRRIPGKTPRAATPGGQGHGIGAGGAWG